jgi:uncharacterized membrane protein
MSSDRRDFMSVKDDKSVVEKIFDEEQGSPKRNFFAKLRAYFLAGIVVTAPIAITIYLTYIFLNLVDSNVKNLIPQHFEGSWWYEQYYTVISFPGIGIIAALVFFVLVGWFTTNFLGKLLIRISEYIVNRMPVIRTLYGGIKQVFETIMASKSQAFREAVMLEYPRRGVWSIGFVTGVSQGEVQRMTDEETINVFVPTTPNPTSGYLLFVPKKELKFLKMSVEDAIKLIVSAGIITPPDDGGKKVPAKPKAKKKKASTIKAKK